MDPTLAAAFERDLWHLRRVETYARRQGFYGLAQSVQDERKAVQERWAVAIYARRA